MSQLELAAARASEAGTADSLGVAADIASIFAAVVAALAIAGVTRQVWRQTFGRRRDVRARLSRLTCGVQLRYFERVLGEPPAVRGSHFIDGLDRLYPGERGAPVAESLRRAAELIGILVPSPRSGSGPQHEECLWVLPEVYVQALIDRAERVVAYSVTLRNRRFRCEFGLKLWVGGPRWRPKRVTVVGGTLGRTRLSDVPRDETDAPSSVTAWESSRAWQYADLYYLGRAGHYLTYVVAATYVGNPKHMGNIRAVQSAVMARDDSPVAVHELPSIVEFRRNTTATTYAVVADLELAKHIYIYGPHPDSAVVRLGR